jgi:hypothetical protein
MLKTLEGFACFVLVALGVVLVAHGAADDYAGGVAAGLIVMVGGLIRGALMVADDA